MQNIEGFDFFPLTFDERGKLQSQQELGALTDRANAAQATDAIFIAHGFRNDVTDATTLYTKFLRSFRGHLLRPDLHGVAERHFVAAGVYWPSKPFRESFEDGEEGTRGIHDPAQAMSDAKAELEDLKAHDASPDQRPRLDKAIALLPSLEGNTDAQDEFVALVLSLLDDSTPDKTEGLDQVRKRSGSELLSRLSAPAGDRTRAIGGIVGTIAGGVGQFLNLTKWYVMKDRSGTVGATGVADAVRTLHAARPSIKIHLVGHSLGGRVMAGCAKGLSQAPKLQADSLMLLEGAFSHFGFSANNGRGTAGFFRDVIDRQVVKGPFVSTFSAQDTVVGKAYSIMSRLAGDNTREIGDASDEFGGIGRNGPQKTTEAEEGPLHLAGTPYAYKPRIITSLDGSGGLITNHSDVTNDAITYAFAWAVAGT